MTNLSIVQQQFVASKKRHKIIVQIARILILVFFIAIWEISARTGLINAFIFSSPSRILSSFISMVKDKTIFYHTGITVFETLLSFSLVTIIGILVAVILCVSKSAFEILDPYLVVLNSLPKSALAPVIIVWLGNSMKAIIVTAILVAVFATIISIYTGFNEVSQDKIKLIYSLGGNKKNALTKVIIPSTVPVIVSTMKVNIGLSLVGVIIGEFLAAKAGLGYLIIYGSQVFKLDWILMSIVILCILASILYSLLNILEKHFTLQR